MFSLGIFEKIGIAAIATAAVFFVGYYKGYSYEHNKFLLFKAEIEAKANAQKEVVQQIESKQKIITEGIKNEYQARIAALELRYRGVYDNSTGKYQMPGVSNTSSGANEASSNLVLNCAITTQQLVSLQEWIKLQKTAQ